MRAHIEVLWNLNKRVQQFQLGMSRATETVSTRAGPRTYTYWAIHLGPLTFIVRKEP